MGTGSFTQSGGTNSATAPILLGVNPGSNGTYNLSGSGLLSAFQEAVGYSGTGIFTQSGGTHAVSVLVLGYGTSGSGTYNLSGSGLLSNSGGQLIGFSGSGSFMQSGGTNMVFDGPCTWATALAATGPIT